MAKGSQSLYEAEFKDVARSILDLDQEDGEIGVRSNVGEELMNTQREVENLLGKRSRAGMLRAAARLIRAAKHTN